jgi:hypothetical protein
MDRIFCKIDFMAFTPSPLRQQCADEATAGCSTGNTLKAQASHCDIAIQSRFERRLDRSGIRVFLTSAAESTHYTQCGLRMVYADYTVRLFHLGRYTNYSFAYIRRLDRARMLDVV